MTTENVDIKVAGTVAPKIESDLRAIAQAAIEGHSALSKLQNMLGKMESSGLSALQNATKSATLEIDKQTRAMQDASAQMRMQAANLRVLQGEVNRNTAANNQNAKSSEDAKNRILELARAGVSEAQARRDATLAAFENARAQQTVTESVRRQVPFTQEQIRAAQEATRAARDRINAARAQAQAEEQLQATQQRTTLGWRDYNAGLAGTARNAQLARHHMLNLGFQLQDIGVSLASGQNPLTVAIQQGAQIQGIAQQAGIGLRGLAVNVGRFIAPMLPFAAALGAVAAGLKIVSDEADSSGLEAYSRKLGLTTREIKKLDGDTITLTDTFKAFFKTIDDATGTSDAFSKLMASLVKVFKNIVVYAVDSFNIIGATVSGVVAVIESTFKSIPQPIRLVFAEMVNSLVNIFQTMVDTVILGTNQIIAALNTVSAVKIQPFENVVLPRVDIPQDSKAFEEPAKVFADAFQSSFEARTKEFENFYQKWQDNALSGAKNRIKTDFEKGRGGQQEESRAAALAKVNAQLDNELNRMMTLKPVREEQAAFDRIEEQLIGRRITLSKSEEAAIRSKIASIAEGVKVQQQYDRIYTESTQANETYNSTLHAAQLLLDQAAISQQQYNGQVAAAREAYEQAIDPLRKYRQEMQFEIDTMSMTSAEREIAIQRRQVEQEALRNGVQLIDSEVDALMRQAEAAQRANQVQAQYNSIHSETAGQLEQIRFRTEALNIAYQNGTIGMQMYQSQMQMLGVQAAQLRIAMDQAIPGDEITATFGRLLEGYQGMAAGVTSALGDMFVSLQDGFSNAIAGVLMGTESIGDALRNVAQSAVQQLLASLIKLGIQYAINAAIGQSVAAAATAGSVAMAATTATAWATPAALVSLASFGANSAPAMAGIGSTVAMSQGLALAGFQEGGYTGKGPADQVAGVVHAGEYVMRADTVSRLGIGVMDAIQNGRPITSAGSSVGVQQGNVGRGSVTVTVINNANGTTATTKQSEDEQGNQDITVTIDSLENALAAKLDSGQGPLSRAIQKNYGVHHQTEVR